MKGFDGEDVHYILCYLMCSKFPVIVSGVSKLNIRRVLVTAMILVSHLPPRSRVEIHSMYVTLL